MVLANAMKLALAEARKFIGATAPNPPVGAAVLDARGEVLAVAAHERAGSAHAEVKALALCEERGVLGRAHTIVVTLEPCDHQGRTPPCSSALLRSPIRRVAYGARDPNPVAGGGGETLRRSGIEIVDGILPRECDELLLPFRTRVVTGLPWIVVKTAHTRTDSMIPPPGRKTFVSDESLRFAHALRKRADGLLTGSGTILKDDPHFTVRHVGDHPGKTRWLAVLDRRRRVPESWIEAARQRGFEVIFPESLETAFHLLAEKGCLEILVEAGPTLTREILGRSLWHRHYRIRQGAPGERDEVSVLTNDNPPDLR